MRLIDVVLVKDVNSTIEKHLDTFDVFIITHMNGGIVAVYGGYQERYNI